MLRHGGVFRGPKVSGKIRASPAASAARRVRVIFPAGRKCCCGAAGCESFLPVPRPLWFKAALVLAAIWLVAGGAIFWARQVKVTPESLTAYLDTHPVESASSPDRSKLIEQVAGQMNALTYEQRREVRVGRRLDAFFKSLTAEEQSRFLDLTLPTGFKQMMESLNRMEPPKRKQFVERALRDMRDHEGEDAKIDQNARKMIDQGFKSFYNEASTEVKMDVAPLLEQLQKNLQGLR